MTLDGDLRRGLERMLTKPGPATSAAAIPPELLSASASQPASSRG